MGWPSKASETERNAKANECKEKQRPRVQERLRGETEKERWRAETHLFHYSTWVSVFHSIICSLSKRRGWGCSYILFIHLPLLHRSYSYITTHTAIASEKWPKRSDCRPQRSPCGVKHGFNNSKPKALEHETVTKHDPTENVCDQTPELKLQHFWVD